MWVDPTEIGLESHSCEGCVLTRYFGHKEFSLNIAKDVLVKLGYDFRGFIVLDEYFRHDLISYRQAVETSERNKNMTVWLEYFCQGVAMELEKTVEALKTQRFQTELPSTYWSINERQRQILNLLENPTAKITNKLVQKMFKISQITASRDLAKLASLGLLFSRGKGRSVYYTKV